MKHRIKQEFENLRSYLGGNLRVLLAIVATSLAVLWIFQSFEIILTPSIGWLIAHRPPLIAFLIFLILVLIGVWHKSKNFWIKYRNSYYLNRSNLNWVDGLLVGLTPIIIWLLISFPRLQASSYFWYPVGTLIIYTLVSYFTANISDVRKSFYPKDNSDLNNSRRHLFTDDPIDSNDQDVIGRGNFAKALKEHIYNLSFKDSFVMGLYGHWGEGKTSVLNLLKQDLKNDNKILVYEFDPWFFADQNAITENFFRGLEDFLAQYYLIPRHIKAHLKLYPEVLVKGFVGMSLNLSNYSEDRPTQLKKEIEMFLSRLGKRVLIVIDDVDRLQKEEMLAVLRLVKLTSRIKNLVFLLSFDPSVVSEILGGIEGGAENYIEKIVQLPIYLPMTDQSKIDKFLLYSYPDDRSEIDKILDSIMIDSGRRKEFDDEFVKMYQTTIQELFPTFRSAKRYLNSVTFRLPFVEREVFLYDFFIIEIFQTFFPEIYADIKTHGWYYISNWTLQTNALSPLSIDKAERAKQIKDHIDALINSHKDRDIIVSLLETIFPEVRGSVSGSRGWRMHSTPQDDEYRRKKRIAHPDCFPKYFMLGVREGVIPDAEFEDELRKWKEAASPENEIEKSLFLKYRKAGKLVDFFERLKLFAGQIDLDLVMPLIRAIYKNCSKLSREGDLWLTEFDQADGVILRLLEDNTGVKPEEIHGIVEEIVKNVGCFDLASLIVLSSSESRTGSLYRVHQNLRSADLRNILAARMKEYFIVGKNDIFTEYKKYREFGFILYQWATRWEDKTQNHKEEVTDYLMDVFERTPKEMGYFLASFVKSHMMDHDKKYFDMGSFEIAYEIEKFRERLSGDDLSAFYDIQEEKDAIDLFIVAYTQVMESRNQKTSG